MSEVGVKSYFIKSVHSNITQPMHNNPL